MRNFGSVIIALLIALPLSVTCQALAAGIPLLTAWLIGNSINPLLGNSISILVVAPISALYLSIPPVRLVQRAFPIRTTLKTRWSFVVGGVLISLGVGVFYPAYRVLHASGPGELQGVVGARIAFVTTAVFSFVLIRRYMTPRRWTERPFVLYLRRFTSFSDRVLIRFIMSALPSGVPLVLLTPVRGGPRDWDPYTVGFAGFKFHNPLASMPLVLKSGTTQWESDIKDLIARAAWVVLDVSERSPAVQSEIAMLDEQIAWNKVTVLRAASEVDDYGPTHILAEAAAYHRSSKAAMPKAIVTAAVISAIVTLTIRFPTFFPSVMWWGLLMMVPSVFQRSLDAESRAVIRARLRRALSQQTNRTSDQLLDPHAT
jgi:hypothetical protein